MWILLIVLIVLDICLIINDRKDMKYKKISGLYNEKIKLKSIIDDINYELKTKENLIKKVDEEYQKVKETYQYSLNNMNELIESVRELIISNTRTRGGDPAHRDLVMMAGGLYPHTRGDPI